MVTDDLTLDSENTGLLRFVVSKKQSNAYLKLICCVRGLQGVKHRGS
jgi:hypothetical protein